MILGWNLELAGVLPYSTLLYSPATLPRFPRRGAPLGPSRHHAISDLQAIAICPLNK